jgi:hypothetical protein
VHAIFLSKKEVMTMECQKIAVSDSPSYEAFESLVEVYFQINGYITSTGKWFQAKNPEKQQGGHRDIDVLAINASETVIVSVSTNLKEKAGLKNGEFTESFLATKEYYEIVQLYLQGVPEYSWMVGKERKVRKILAVANVEKQKMELIKKINENDIEVLHREVIFNRIKEYVSIKGLKIQHEVLKAFQLLHSDYGKIE